MDKLPNFFLVGASKSGTTAICDALTSHPDICFSENKEPNFFSNFDSDLKEIPDEQLLEYKKLFRHHSSEKLIGEGSVKYLMSRNAAYWIRKYIPSAKILIVLRNPLKRIVSLYEMYVRVGVMKMSPEEAFSENSYLINQCMMSEKIEHYINTFSRDQVFIMIYEDFLSEPEQEFNSLCRFLGVAENLNPVIRVRNRGGIPRSKLLNFLRDRRLIEIVKKVLPLSEGIWFDNFVKRTFFKKLSLKSNQKKELEKIFYSDVSKVGNLIDRDLLQETLRPIFKPCYS